MKSCCFLFFWSGSPVVAQQDTGRFGLSVPRRPHNVVHRLREKRTAHILVEYRVRYTLIPFSPLGIAISTLIPICFVTYKLLLCRPPKFEFFPQHLFACGCANESLVSAGSWIRSQPHLILLVIPLTGSLYTIQVGPANKRTFPYPYV